METDIVERLIDQWRQVRQDLDPTPMRTSGRLLRIAQHLESRLEAVLGEFGLATWQFDVLAALRRSGRPLSPTELFETMMLSSGAMTNRLDRLEARGWLRREPNPEDRRGVLVRLTAEGVALADRAVEARFREAARVEECLSSAETEKLAELLARMERHVDPSRDPES